MKLLKNSLAVSVITAVLGCLVLMFVGCADDEEISTFTVTYSANEGIGTAPAAVTVGEGQEVTCASGTGLTRAGYTFIGWNTKTDGTGISYPVGEKFTTSKSLTLYAVWKINDGIIFPATTASVKFYVGDELETYYGIGLSAANFINADNTSATFWATHTVTISDAPAGGRTLDTLGRVTIDTAYILVKYPTLEAGHFNSSPSRHAAADYMLTENIDPNSPDKDHPICRTYAVDLGRATGLGNEFLLGTINGLEPGDHGSPWLRVFWPGSEIDADNWWNRAVQVDNSPHARPALATLKSKNAGYYISGRIQKAIKSGSDANDPLKVTGWETYTYEVVSQKQFFAGLPQQTSNGGPKYVWDLGIGDTLHLYMRPHANHWLGRVRDYRIYDDIATLKNAANHIVFSPTTMVNYKPANKGANTNTQANPTPMREGWNFMNLIDDELDYASPTKAAPDVGTGRGWDFGGTKVTSRIN